MAKLGIISSALQYTFKKNPIYSTPRLNAFFSFLYKMETKKRNKKETAMMIGNLYGITVDFLQIL
jgi:hypothetical protein